MKKNTAEFEKYKKREIERIRIQNYGTIYEGYIEDLVLVEYYMEEDKSPFECDGDCSEIENFKKDLFRELLKIDNEYQSRYYVSAN